MNYQEALQTQWNTLNALKDSIGDRGATDQERRVAEMLLNQIDEIESMGSQSTRRSMKPDLGDRSVRSSGPFPTFAEQLRSIWKAGQPGESVDKRLYEVRSPTGLSEGTAGDGGFLVAPDFSREIWKTAFEVGQLVNLVRRIPIQSSSIKINAINESSRVSSRYGGIVAYWLAEAGQKQYSKPSFRQMELSLKKLILLCAATDELLEDSILLENTIRMGFAHEIGFQLDAMILNGTGVGQGLGFMNSGCRITVARNTANDIKINDIVNMWSRLIPGSHQNSTWVISADAVPNLYQISQTVGTQGFPVYLPAGGLSATPYSTLMGRPIIISEHCQTLGTSGDLVLGDFSQYLLATRGETKIDSTIHLLFRTDETVFRGVARLDSQPALNAPVTPKVGNTLSHFVTLS